MKLLLLNQTFYPDRAGTAQYLLDIATYFRDRGWEVTVVASRRAYGEPSVVHPAHERLKGIEIWRVYQSGWGRRSFFHRLVDAVCFEFFLALRLMRLPRFDVVMSFTSPPL